jgi:UDP-glucuronate 4-epimerase
LQIVLTGAAGFIGFHLARRLLGRGDQVIGVDEINAYYDPALKTARVEQLCADPAFRFVRLDISDAAALADLVRGAEPTAVVHLAAQAGVRYSLDYPFEYQRCNLAGHLSVLEACRHAPSVRHLVYASSSSVYGERHDGRTVSARGFREEDVVDDPVSLYAATKRSAELMSGVYSKLYGMAQTGLRFFTVYGPWGRPDMAYFRFAQQILAGEPIDIYGDGRMARDFTYIDDIVEGILGLLARPAAESEHRLFNIGAGRPIGLMRMIEILEETLGHEALKRFLPMQPGDVAMTHADISRLAVLTGYEAQTPLEVGLPRFAAWYRGYYGGAGGGLALPWASPIVGV